MQSAGVNLQPECRTVGLPSTIWAMNVKHVIRAHIYNKLQLCSRNQQFLKYQVGPPPATPIMHVQINLAKVSCIIPNEIHRRATMRVPPTVQLTISPAFNVPDILSILDARHTSAVCLCGRHNTVSVNTSSSRSASTKGIQAMMCHCLVEESECSPAHFLGDAKVSLVFKAR